MRLRGIHQLSDVKRQFVNTSENGTVIQISIHYFYIHFYLFHNSNRKYHFYSRISTICTKSGAIFVQCLLKTIFFHI